MVTASVSPKVVIVIEPSDRSKDVRKIKVRFRIRSQEDPLNHACVVQATGRVGEDAFAVYGPPSTFSFHANPKQDGPTAIELYADFMEITDVKNKKLLEWKKNPTSIANVYAWSELKNLTFYIKITGIGLERSKVRVESSGVQ